MRFSYHFLNSWLKTLFSKSLSILSLWLFICLRFRSWTLANKFSFIFGNEINHTVYNCTCALLRLLYTQCIIHVWCSFLSDWISHSNVVVLSSDVCLRPSWWFLKNVFCTRLRRFCPKSTQTLWISDKPRSVLWSYFRPFASQIFWLARLKR